jgi:hypothetical protein
VFPIFLVLESAEHRLSGLFVDDQLRTWLGSGNYSILAMSDISRDDYGIGLEFRHPNLHISRRRVADRKLMVVLRMA